MKNRLSSIRRLVGAITKEQLRYIDCFVAEEIALFMPVGGPCFYTLTPEHTHPAYMFVLNFKSETGKAPMEYVQDLRLERARKLLLAGDKTMTEIALDCGFGSPSYLSACFQKKYKMTPKEYRKHIG